MSGSVFSSQNLNRTQSAASIFSTAQATFNNTAAGRDRGAVAGALLTSFGGLINSFNQSRPKETYGFNISEFVSVISKQSGFINPTHFMVYITPPKFVNQNITNSQESKLAHEFGYVLPFLCCKIDIPGVVFNYQEIKHFGYGTSQRRPTNAVFKDVSMQFYIDNTSVALDFFTKWMQKIINYDIEATGPKNTGGAFFNEVSYMSDYATEVDIHVFDSTATRVLNIKLHEAYPVSMGELKFDWRSEDDTIATLPISMTFNTWSSNYLTPAKIDANSLRNLSLGDALIRLGVGATTLSSLVRRPLGIADIFNTVRTASTVANSILR